MESYVEQISRLRSMANDSPQWDLSTNDCAAIQTALLRIEQLEAELSRIRNGVEKLDVKTLYDAQCEGIEGSVEIIPLFDVEKLIFG